MKIMKKGYIFRWVLIIMLFFAYGCFASKGNEKKENKNIYLVVFESNGGTTISAIKGIPYGGVITEPSAPTKFEYIFAGWYLDKELTRGWDFKIDRVTKNLTLYAKWKEAYSVMFESNGGTKITGIKGITYGAVIAEPIVPTKAEYIFAGWYNDKELTKVWDFKTDKVTKNIILYAKWTETYSVAFESNGGSDVKTIADIINGTGIQEPISPTKIGYKFVRWYKEKSLVTPWNFENDKVTSDVTLYAKWVITPKSGENTNPKYLKVEKGTTSISNGSITVYNNFYISKYEVTQEEYVEVTGLKNPSDSFGVGTKYPVYNITWYDAIKYCNQLSLNEGYEKAYNETTGELLDTNGAVTTNVEEVKGYRLPTSVEWEYAARGGTNGYGFLYSGSDIIDEVAWYVNNAENSAKEVGLKKANELGVFDMSGNLWEWCHDWHNLHIGSTHLWRGGSYINNENNCRVDYFWDIWPTNSSPIIGFRPVRTEKNIDF